DPTLAAIAMAIHYEQVSLSDIVVICIGMGLTPNWIASDTHTWGAQQWQHGDGNPLSCTPALLVNGCVSPVLNASMNGTSVSPIPDVAGMMLRSPYAYLNPTMAYYTPENDVNPADLQESGLAQRFQALDPPDREAVQHGFLRKRMSADALRFVWGEPATM